MQADALAPVEDNGDSEGLSAAVPVSLSTEFTPEVVEEAAYFLRLGVRLMSAPLRFFQLTCCVLYTQPLDRLRILLSYLRDKYSYCFWCGTEYENSEDMQSNCPGMEEEDHD